MAKYTITVKVGKRPDPIKLRLAVVRLRALADRLEALAVSVDA
jgi:hypothetical protein